MKVIVPCCGRSTRFPNQPPKWMLQAHDGRPMIYLATAGLHCSPNDLVVTILREHEERFDVTAGLAQAFGRPVATCILEQPTRSQAETVAATLRALDLREPFLVKDSDNTFVLDPVEQPDNYICVDSLNNYDLINPRNKSYLQIDHKGVVSNIREKVVISDTFNVGGYYFTSPQQFNEFYERLSADKAAWNREMYLSDVIGAMILEGIPFRARRITDYHDWGTIHDWRRALGASKTLFLSLDGFIFERGSPFFRPRFSDVKPHPHAVEAVKALIAEGAGVVYLSIRPEAWKEVTERQLEDAGLPRGPVLFDCPMTKWLVVGSPHATAPFRSTESCELEPDHPRLLEILRNVLHGDA